MKTSPLATVLSLSTSSVSAGKYMTSLNVPVSDRDRDIRIDRLGRKCIILSIEPEVRASCIELNLRSASSLRRCTGNKTSPTSYDCPSTVTLAVYIITLSPYKSTTSKLNGSATLVKLIDVEVATGGSSRRPSGAAYNDAAAAEPARTSGAYLAVSAEAGMATSERTTLGGNRCGVLSPRTCPRIYSVAELRICRWHCARVRRAERMQLRRVRTESSSTERE